MKRLLLLFLTVMLAVPAVSCFPSPAPKAAAPVTWPTQEWPTSTPEEQGIDSAKLAEGLQAIRQQGLNVHSLLLIRNGKLVLDAYFYPYDGATVHDVASVSKSIMTTLIAIAADQGKLKLDDPLLSFFPDRTIANRDAAKERITVRHLTSMSSGLDCTAANDEQTLHEMERSEDYVQFTLDRKMISEPGARFVYCSPGMHLLSAILQKATGMTTLDFAQQNLFAPLGINNVVWPADDQGVYHGWGDIHIHPGDMAKIGFLWLNHGQWEGKQIVPQAWVQDSVKTQLKTGGDDNYGYGWWITGDQGEYAAVGRGGQRIQVWPAINTILVMTGGGVEIDDLEPMLSPAFVEMSKPLPANPTGVAQLKSALDAITQAPMPKAVAPLPAIAQDISGKVYVFEPNPLEITQMGVTFAPTASPSAEATLQIALDGEELMSWPVGLDGVYRLFPGEYDLPQGLRGQWEDEQTFVAEYDNIANNDHLFLRLQFADDRLVVESHETAHELGVRIEGRLQETAIKTTIPSTAACSTPLVIDPAMYQDWWTYTNCTYGFTLRVPPGWGVEETTGGDTRLVNHLLNLYPLKGGESLNIRITFRRAGDQEILLWPTGVGEGEFVTQGTLRIAGEPAQRLLFVCPSGEVNAIWYHQSETEANLRRGDLEFGVIFGYKGPHCQPGDNLSGEDQRVGEMIIASLTLP